jgi:hypothetical protein
VAAAGRRGHLNGVDERGRQLYDEGARRLRESWDDDAGLIRYVTPFGTFHDGRGSIAYAEVLLREDGDIATVERILRNVAAMQELRPHDAHYGNFRWLQEDAGVTDLNAVEFILDGLNALVRDLAADDGRRHDGADGVIELIHDMMALGLEEIDRLDVHPSYTNIALSDICNSVMGGEALGDRSFVERGRRRLEEWFEYTNRSGAPHEYNSPTYIAVDIMRMAALAEATRDPEIAFKARVAEERLWLHVAAHYHPQLAQLAGPHARSYRDGWTGAGGYLKLLLWKLLGDGNLRRMTPYFPKGREEGFTGVGRATLHCPGYVLDALRNKRFPFTSRECADAGRSIELTTHMRESYALGSATVSYGVGEPPEPWPQPNGLLLYTGRDEAPGYGVLFCRYVVNDKEAGAVMHESGRNAEDFWEEGQQVAAQHGSRAIVAYGLRPRTRPARSFKLTVRMFGANAAWAGDEPLGSAVARVAPGQPVVVDAGGAYVAVVPLEPSDMGAEAGIEARLEDGMLIVDIYNYRGPDKTFWEHRSQAGPFYRGNVRNAFAIEVAGRDEHADISAFRRHVAGARVTDSVDEAYAREIVYASDGGSVALRYSLWDMRVIERRGDGEPLVTPMGRAGADDGRGWQWTQARDALIELSGARLMAGRAPTWFAADAERGRYVSVNPSDEPAPLWLETPATVVECDEIGFARFELDERENAVSVESPQLGAPVRVRARERPRLLVNGEDCSDGLRALADDAWEYTPG